MPTILSIVGGLARFNGQSVMVIGQQKGRDTKEKILRNFGMPRPEGYRKAMRLMRLAEKFGIPVLTFVDTPGAYPGIGAEERGQSEAIGRSLYVMAELRVPVICTVIGEGGSGGALALAVGDIVMMLQYAIYSVISPEGCASILWKSADKAPEAAETLGITAGRLKTLGLIDKIISEPLGGAHRDHAAMAQNSEKGVAGCAALAGEQGRRRIDRSALRPPDGLWQVQGSRNPNSLDSLDAKVGAALSALALSRGQAGAGAVAAASTRWCCSRCCAGLPAPLGFELSCVHVNHHISPNARPLGRILRALVQAPRYSAGLA